MSKFEARTDVQDYLIDEYGQINIWIISHINQNPVLKGWLIPLKFLNFLHEQFGLVNKQKKQSLLAAERIINIGFDPFRPLMVNPTKTNDFIEQDILCDETRMLFFSCIVKLIDKKIELTSKQIEQRELNACRTFIDTHQKRRARKILDNGQKGKDQTISGTDSKANLVFSSKENMNNLFDLLKGHFPEKENELKVVLAGQNLDLRLYYKGNQNQLVEVFRRAIYNRIITSTARDVTKWLCKNFSFFHNRDQSIRPLNEITVYELLTKGKGEPTKGSRICAADWLPYKSPSTLDSKNKN